MLIFLKHCPKCNSLVLIFRNFPEERKQILARLSTKEINEEDELGVKERPQTTGGRIFGNISEDLHNEYKPKHSKLTNIDLPSA